MMKLPLFLLLPVLMPFTATAQDSYTFMVDRNFSSPVGAENLLTVHRLTYTLENGFLMPSYFDENSISGKTLGVSYRLGKTILLDNVIDEFAIVVQHEVFGHGARVREYKFNDIGYQINAFPPYGTGGGLTWWNYPPEQPFCLDGDLSITIAGVEATSIMSRRLAMGWLQRGSINYRETVLYSMASNSLTLYLWLTKLGWKNSNGNDMTVYEAQVNLREGYMVESKYKLKVDDLAKQSLIIGLDPFQYFSLYTYFKDYLWSGQESFEFPMIALGQYRYLPSFRLGLSPFGSEIYFDNFFARSNTVADVCFRYGIPTFHRFWGISFYGMNVYQVPLFSVDIGVDVWNQPEIDLFTADVSETRGGLGGAILCRVLAKIVDTFAALSIVGEMKAKTSGYLQGEPLGDALVLRAGVSVSTK